jgi:hypothetical protein
MALITDRLKRLDALDRVIVLLDAKGITVKATYMIQIFMITPLPDGPLFGEDP